jgi:hypothetical protein
MDRTKDMPDNASRRGAVDMGLPLMLIAVAVMGGFVYWLMGQSEAERAMRLVEEAPVEEVAPDSRTIAPEDIQMDATPFEGQEIRLESLNVASLLGTQGFWLEMPNGNPFLVSMSPAVMAMGLNVAPGTHATVVGRVVAMNDSTLTAWTTASTIAEGDRIVAEFATHYIDATEVEVGAAGMGAGN